MGGHNAGAVASAMAVDAIETFFRSYHAEPHQVWPYPVDRSLSLAANLLRVGIKVANDKIREAAAADRARARMGTTAVAMAIGEEQLAIAHAGDSRAYRFRGGSVTRLTRDHSVAEEMRAARPEMTDEELATFAHRNVVTRSLGSKEELEPAVYVGRVQPGDIYPALQRRSVGRGPRRKDRRRSCAGADDLEAACQMLVDAANEAGGPGQRLGAARARRLTASVELHDPRARRAESGSSSASGPGGVGKTTTAAALGALAARLGRKTLVCTIDPAPRLADALGDGRARPRAAAGPARGLPRAGDRRGGRGRLYAVRLDTARAFARLVEEQVADPEMRRRIFDNTIYRQITTTLTGSQEYAATLALYELARAGAYDLIVLDTPPTANALDFLDAPKRIAAAVSSPALSWFARPPGRRAAALLSFRRLRAGGRARAAAAGQAGRQPVPRRRRGLPDRLSGGAGRASSTRAKAVDALLRGAGRRPSCWCWRRRWPPSTRRCTFTAGCARRACRSAAFIANRVQPRARAHRRGRAGGGAARGAARSPICRRRASPRRRRAWRRSPARSAALHAAERREIGAAGGARAGDGDHRGAAARSRRGQPG